MPAADVVTLLILGFCNEEVNPLGPVHEYTVPPSELRFNVLPVQPALLEAVAAGFAFVVNARVVDALHPLELVTVTE